MYVHVAWYRHEYYHALFELNYQSVKVKCLFKETRAWFNCWAAYSHASRWDSHIKNAEMKNIFNGKTKAISLFKVMSFGSLKT